MTSMDMATASDHALATEQAILKVTFAALATALLFSGMQFFMVIHGLYLYFESPVVTRTRRRLYVVLSVAICLLSSFGVTIDTIEVQHVLTELREPGAALRYLDEPAEWSAVLSSACLILSHLLADGLLLYRCYIIWQGSLGVMFLPTMLFTAFAGTGIAYFIHSLPAHSPNIGLASALCMMSAALNTGVTGLIIWKLLRSRRQLTRLLNAPDRTMYTGVIGLLVASALPFSVVAIVAAVMNLPGLQHPAGMYFTALWGTLSSFCPQLIIYRVAHEKGIMTGYDVETSSLGSLNFDQTGSSRSESYHLDLESTADSSIELRKRASTLG